MALGVHEVLFNLIGEEKDARQALESVAAELTAFSKISAEAEAKVEVADAEERIKALRIELENLDKTVTAPKIKTDIGLVLAQIETVEKELAALDGQTAVVDVDVRKDLLDRMQSLTAQTGLLTKAVDTASGSQKSFFGTLLDTGVSMGPFTTSLKVAGPVIGALSAAIASVVGALAALASSLAFAVAGAGALAIAFGGALVPAIGAAFLAIQRFKEESEKAGTPAHALLQAFNGLKDAAATLQSAMDPIFRGMAAAVEAATPVVAALKDEFKVFARAIGDAFRIVGGAITRMKGPIEDLVAAAGPVFKQLARIASGFGGTLLNIANAAMPFLIEGLRQIGDAMRGWEKGTSNAGALGTVIGMLVSHLEAWLGLLKQVSRVLINFFTAAAPAGRELVGWFAEGAEKLADFLASAEGQNQIKQFMEDVIPLFKELIEFVGKAGSAFLKAGQVLAPVFQPAIAGINMFLDVLNFLLDLLNKIPAPIRGIIGFLASLMTGFGAVRGIVQAVSFAFGLLSGVGGTLKAILRALGDAASWVGDKFSAVPGILAGVGMAILNAILAPFRRMIGLIRGLITTAINIIRAVFSRGPGIIAGIASKIVSVAGNILGRITSFVSNIFSRAVAIVGSVFSRAVGIVSGIVGRIISTIGNVLGRVASIVGNAFSNAVHAAGNALGNLASAVGNALSNTVSVVTGFVGDFLDAGRAIAQAIIDGFTGIIGDLANVAEGAVQKVKDILPFSEPKDPNSPLRHLDKSGEAIINNMVDGIKGSGSLLASSLAKELAHTAPILRAPMQASQKAAAGAPVYHQTYEITTPDTNTSLDPRMAAMQLALLQRQRGTVAA